MKGFILAFLLGAYLTEPVRILARACASWSGLACLWNGHRWHCRFGSADLYLVRCGVCEKNRLLKNGVYHGLSKKEAAALQLKALQEMSL